jgi:hypothetical protein
VALWKVALEAMTAEIAEGGGIAVGVLRVAQHLSRHGPCPRGAEQAA